jgi:hypothetical protein
MAGLLLAQWAQQMPMKQETRSDLLRRDFEAGVAYLDAPVAAVWNPCLADDWSVVIDWGDGTGEKVPTRRDAPQVACAGSGCVPPGGPYQLWSDHAYRDSGKYFVRVEPRVHCFGSHGGAIPYPAGFHAAVYPRLPLAKAWLSRSSAAPGERVTLRVRLTGTAPPSGTRVFLRATPDTTTGVPAFVQVASGATEASVDFAVSGTPGPMSIVASTVADRPLRMALKIVRR